MSVDLPVETGERIHALAKTLWPICRSITGRGVRETLAVLRASLPELTIHGVPTGTRCFDWVVPREWIIRDAFIVDPSGRKVVDFQQSNLHVVGYSTPVDCRMSLEDLQAHLYSLPNQPDAIPYVTSYYEERWGFCLSDRVRQSLEPGEYRVKIDSELKPGLLNYGEVVLPGECDAEVLLSTYICHPSLANNELSGPCVTTFLARWLKTLERRRYTYRILFLPETIGSICYISQHLEALRQNVVAGFVVTCVGDDRGYSFLPSRRGDTFADRAATHVLGHFAPGYAKCSFLDRGSDERQFCSPGVDLPVVSVMRTKYGLYPEYHTSLDDLSLITPHGLAGGYEVLRRVLAALEADCVPHATTCCEPCLGSRGLRPTLSRSGGGQGSLTLSNLLAYSDGQSTLLEIADLIGVPIWTLVPPLQTLISEGLLQTEPPPGH